MLLKLKKNKSRIIIIMTRKGNLEEIFSKAIFSDETKLYKITYRDYEKSKETPLNDFLNISNNFETIPSSRIELVTKQNKILFKKTSR